MMSFSQLSAVKKDIIFGVHLKQISYYFGALEIKSCKFLAYELELLWFFLSTSLHDGIFELP